MKRSKHEMSTTLLIAGLGLASILGLGAFRHANAPGDRDEHMVRRLDAILERIDATPEQAERIRAIRDELMAARPQRDPAKRGELMRIWDQETLDADAIHAAIDERFDERRAFAHRVADAMIEIHGILTPEQREEVKELFEKKARRGKRGEGRKMKRPAPAGE